jgi:biotin carboxyl carrier protein
MEAGRAAGGHGQVSYVAAVDGQRYEVTIDPEGTVWLDGVPVEVDLQSIDGGFHYSLLLGAASHEVFVEHCDDFCMVTLDGQRYRVQVEDKRARRTRARGAGAQEAGEAEVLSPMPGVVVAVLVGVGQEIRAGEGLLILEAMKMENEIRAPRSGTVEAVQVTAGQRVSKDDVLVRIG